MTDVDLKGIHFRAYEPQLDDNEEYVPLGPGDYASAVGAIDLGIIKIRAWQHTDKGLTTNTDDSGVFDADESPGDVGGITWPTDEESTTTEENKSHRSTAELTLEEDYVFVPVEDNIGSSANGTQAISGVQNLTEVITESHSSAATISIAIDEDITSGGSGNYGEGNYGDGPYGG